jgi:hypothetical protein
MFRGRLTLDAQVNINAAGARAICALPSMPPLAALLRHAAPRPPPLRTDWQLARPRAWGVNVDGARHRPLRLGPAAACGQRHTRLSLRTCASVAASVQASDKSGSAVNTCIAKPAVKAMSSWSHDAKWSNVMAPCRRSLSWANCSLRRSMTAPISMGVAVWARDMPYRINSVVRCAAASPAAGACAGTSACAPAGLGRLEPLPLAPAPPPGAARLGRLPPPALRPPLLPLSSPPRPLRPSRPPRPRRPRRSAARG